MIDFDANATTALLPEVLEAMMPWLTGEGYANPSGSYRAAKRARQAIEAAREQVAALIGASPGEIVFTSGGTESIHAALGSLDRLCGPGHAVVSAIEHSAVLRGTEALQRPCHHLAVTPQGCLPPADPDLLPADAAFLSLMLANNETGVIQPLAEWTALARSRGLPIHTDAVQAAGKIPLDVSQLGVDLLSLSAHKFHGPKGVGALWIRNGLDFSPSQRGGGQENGRRSGTENTAGIVGMGRAAELARAHLATENPSRLAALRDAFEQIIMTRLEGVTVNGSGPAPRLPNTSHLSFEGCDAAGLLILLDESGIACSAGSACMSGKQKPSHVQQAMGIPPERARSSLRFSLSRLADISQVETAAESLIRAVTKLRRIQSPGVGPVLVYSPVSSPPSTR